VAGVINGDGSPLPRDQMGLPTTGWYSTSFEGSQGILASETAGGEVGSPVVSAPFGSSQLPENRPRLLVTGGDTSGFSDDRPIHESFLTPSHSDTTGIGGGSYGSDHAAGRP